MLNQYELTQTPCDCLEPDTDKTEYHGEYCFCGIKREHNHCGECLGIVETREILRLAHQ